eukprot:COSAG02_NODE_2155_length_9651_cov_112.913544_6_plen_73_part_00
MEIAGTWVALASHSLAGASCIRNSCELVHIGSLAIAMYVGPSRRRLGYSRTIHGHSRLFTASIGGFSTPAPD